MSINLGEETEILEFKTSTAELPAALDSIVAILNKHQKGTLYFGVKNNGTPVGQQMGSNTLRDVTASITSHIEPKIYPTVEKIVLDGKECIKVEFEGEDIPYFSNGRAYIRVGDEDKKMSQQQIKNLIIKSSNIDEKWEKKVTEYTYEDVNEELLKACIKQGNESKRINYEYTNKRDILNRLGLINKDGKLLNAGNALFGKNANIVLKMAIFATDTKVTFLDLSRKVGNIIELINIGETYVKEHIKWTVNFETGRTERLEIPEIPVTSIRESIMNCLCHQSMISNQDAEIDIYKNRIEIYNPGQFPNEYTPEDFINGKGKSILRNKLIGQTLFLSHEIESFGTGIRRIYEECNKNNVKVEFKQDELGFTVIFYRKSDKELEKVATEIKNVGVNVGVNAGVNVGVNKTQKRILEIIIQKNNVTQEEIAKEIKTTKRTIERNINVLKEKGLIERVGADKTGYWKIIK
jgi:ATP-dependent DNA helicase RecG